MFTYFILVLTISCNYLSPPFLDGDMGFYTTSASFYKQGKIQLSLLGSYGTKKDMNGGKKESHNQINLNASYSIFRYVELGTGINYFNMGQDNFKELFLKTKIPFLSSGRIKSSIAPYITFTEGEKPCFTANIDIETIPFTRKSLPSFLIGQSVNIGRKKSGNILEFSSLLSLETGRFQPFIEFYTEFSERISSSFMANTRFCSGLGLNIGNLVLRGGVEIPLEDYTKRNFDYRFTGGINYLFDTKRKPKGKLNITILDEENEMAIPATIMIKGKEVERIIECQTGICIIEDLPFGFYTIEIENPEYQRIKRPLFIKEKSVNKPYKLTKKDKKKGGDSSE